MKKILFLLIILILISGCNYNKNKENEKNIDINIIYKKKENVIYEKWIPIYEGDNYRYVIFDTYIAYVEYEGQQLSYAEALNQNLVTIDSLREAGVSIFKEDMYKKKDNIKILYREKTNNEASNTAEIFIYEDELYKYSIRPTVIAYIEYEGKQISYNEALQQKLVILDDFHKVAEILKKEK